jgi:hypothetical protein|tara:strand:+ start:611 stop:910 length:300 start_codon:yes stop_codon:yes gene_type:complete
MKYICSKCNATKFLGKMTISVVEGKVVTKEALCKCGEYMEQADKSFKGFPTQGIKNEARRVREVTHDDYYGTNKHEGYREKEQWEINKKMGLTKDGLKK